MSRIQRLQEAKQKIEEKVPFKIQERKQMIADINDEIQERGGKVTLKNVKGNAHLVELLKELTN